MQKAFEELYTALENVIDVALLLPDVVRVLLRYKDDVIAWIESKEFKETYAKHPYPPLINPKSIDYTQTPATLAWELNLPLPPYFDFLSLTSHGSGSTGMNNFLAQCGCVMINCVDISDARAVYMQLYDKILAHRHHKHVYLFINDYVLRGEYQKYFALIPKKPALYLVYDPISVLKHYLGAKRLVDGGGRYFTLACDPTLVLASRIGYGFIKKKTAIPTTDEIPFWMNYLPLCFHDAQLLKALEIDNVHYVDMQEILGEGAFDTMCHLAQKFHFPPPKECDREFYARKVSAFNFGFPLTLYAYKDDIAKLENGYTNDLSSCDLEGGISLTITTRYAFKGEEMDITSAFFKESIEPLMITASEQDYISLLQDPTFAWLCATYLRDFVSAVLVKKDQELQKALKEEDILEYFKTRKFFREKFQKILKKSLQHVSANRPDIIKTWKYYAQFLEMCEAL